jgi:hypothetical protein
VASCAAPVATTQAQSLPSSPCPAASSAPSPVAPVVAGPPAFDPAPWLADFHQLLGELSSHYANLEAAREQRHMDLPALAARTEAELRDARTADAARRALQSFLRAFGDGHLALAAAPESAPSPSSEPAPAARPLCDRLGYGHQRVKEGVDFTLVPGFEPSADADAVDMPGGVLRLPSGVRLGVVRIALFMTEIHPALCEPARLSLGLADDAACDDECGFRVELAVSNLLLAALDRRLASLRKAGAAGVVVDLTGNGGGSDWVDPAAREMTALPLRAPRMLFPRHPHWSENLKQMLHDVEADVAGVNDARRSTLASAASVLRAAIADAERPCDTSGLWTKGGPAPACSMLVRTAYYTSGLLPYAKSGAFAGLHAEELLFKPGQYRYREGANRLPVVVLVDEYTASSAELFTAMLRDNGAAMVAGAPTVGAGCGYTNGGIPTVLRNSGLKVRVPDCVRLRADGSDEVAGIVPDVLLPFTSRDSPYQRAAVAREGLERAWKRR